MLIAAFAGVAAAALALIAWNDPAINFLRRHQGAEWIVFPAAVDARAHWYASLDAIFRREFILARQPATARLNIRAMRRAEVKINGAAVRVAQNRIWKEVTSTDVAEQLRAGTNVIEARVFNHNGPPALWLSLITDQLSIQTDENWDTSFAGSSWRHAALAATPKTPGPGNAIAGGERPFDAAEKNWPLWILMVAVASVVLSLWHVSLKRFTSVRLEPIISLVFAGVWLLLFWNNTRLLPFHAGFDSKEHLKYIDYIQKHWAVPLPTEGWEMYQPPLYYFIAAVILSVCKLSINDPTSVVALRAVGAFCGMAQFTWVYLSLRLVLPTRTALVGLLLAAFLPMHLYMAHYVTNELLTATLATLTVYLCLRLFKTETPRAAQFVFVGLALGATMLTKATGILLVPIAIAAILARLVQRRSPVAVSLRNFGLLLATCLAVCGWHYARVWLRFGTPLLGNWDVISGFTWWQDPGYHTAADYLSFGRSLIAPLFSGFSGFADGIYSTLWGDGLSGGASSVNFAWNHEPMAAGYLWALVPAALIVLGAGVAVVRFVRAPSPEFFLLLAFAGVVALGLIFMTLKVPSYAQAKAFYGLSALTPLCFFGALGWQTVTHGRTRLRFIMAGLLLMWALNSLATFWIVPSVPQHVYAVRAFGTEGKMDRANAEAVKAVESNPSSATARGYYALCLSELGNDAEAAKEGERVVELAPMDSAAHLSLAIAINRADPERAIVESRRAIELGPENVSAYEFLMNYLLASRRYDEAAQLGPEWLVVAPFDVTAHLSLGVAMAQTGDLISAVRNLGYATILRPAAEQPYTQLRQILLSLAKEPDGAQQLRTISADAPDSPRMLDEMAWLLSTYPDSKTRDGSEAVRLAERACALTDRRIPAFLDTLAAAYAEAGDFSRAINIGEEALNRARANGDSDAVKLSENVLASLRQNLPYRQEPE